MPQFDDRDVAPEAGTAQTAVQETGQIGGDIVEGDGVGRGESALVQVDRIAVQIGGISPHRVERQSPFQQVVIEELLDQTVQSVSCGGRQ